MKRTELIQEVRKMRFEEAYSGWQERRLTQEGAARLLIANGYRPLLLSIPRPKAGTQSVPP
jgi:hypothetical protein